MNIEVRLSQFENSLTWSSVFGNDYPVICEIGSGKGRFLVNSASANPEINYLGIERAAKYHRLIRQRIERQGLNNVRLLNSDADHFVRTYVPSLSVRAYYILFPDPWPKKRHRKRRLVTEAFIEGLLPTLASGGCIYYKTDFEDYFEQMLSVSRARPELMKLQSRAITPDEVEAEQADTNFERKYLMQGRIIYSAVFQKFRS